MLELRGSRYISEGSSCPERVVCVSGAFARSGNRCVIDVAVRNEGTCAGDCTVASDSNFADWSGALL